MEALDRMNLLRDIVVVLSDSGANVLSSNTVSHRDGIVDMRFLFQVSDVANIEKVLVKLRGIEGVFEAKRMMPSNSKASRKG